MAVSKTKFHSWCTGKLSEGCALCVKGRKLVLFITGLCGQRCFYCPVSEQKYGKDVVFANEWRVVDANNPVELFEEAELTDAKGAGITGGDPLVKVDRCCAYIRILKERFGKEFHIHLYTPLKLVTEERLQKLYDAGLDELRLHPNLDDRTLWERIELARKYDWDLGIEIPVVPGYEEKTKALIDFIAGRVDFLNLNELELSDTQTAHYNMGNFVQKNKLSYGVKGSEKIALKLLKYAEAKGIRAHYCTAKLKDAVQMTNRIKLRAKRASLPFDIHTSDGLLQRGCVYLPELKPGVGYREHLKKADNKLLSKLENAREKVMALGVSGDKVVVDNKKFRLLMPPELVKKLRAQLKSLGFVPAIVEEYPTADAIETDIEFI